MNHKIIYSILSTILILIAAVWYIPNHTWRTVSQDGASGGGFGPSGKGVGFSTTTWKSMDDVMIEEVIVAYASAEDAQQDFAEELKNEEKIVERDAQRGGAGGDARIIKVLGDPKTREGAAEIIKLEGTQIRYINAGSVRYALMFERAWIRSGF